MSDPSFVQMRTIIQSAIADSSNPQFVDQCLNQAQREVARARRWPEMMSRLFFNTEAAYETGKMAVTNASTTITLTTGTLPSTVASSGYRFALSVSDPWYTVRTRTSASVGVLAQTYAQDTNTSTSYILYKSHYSMPSTVDRIEEVWLHDDGEAVPLVSAATDQQVSLFTHYPTGTGVPTHFYMMERDSLGNRQVLLGPDTPDDVYRVEVTYRRKVTEGAFAGNLDDSRFPVILARALSMAYAPEYYERSQVEYAKYLKLLDQEWMFENEVESDHIRVGQGRISYPNLDGYHGIIGNGVVEEPTA